ncbi:CotH kinase family protein [Oenococcus oeni]|uniref:CotH kinase family protein n=1 Tax=Oenococcus oeni TaxID=1247 RepID=UPI0007A752C2|nr:CotH kinase family protein [Oenococcus oeni]KZD14383.1 hypothetical protein AC229_1037 [Oenococcus oeni]
MAIFEAEGNYLQNEDFRDHLNRNWKNGNDRFDSINAQFLKLGSSGQAGSLDEVQQARTDAHGNTFQTLKSRDDAQQITAENALTVASSKADADYIQQYLSQMSYVPETFANLTALKAAYPSGKAGLFIVADTGNKYIWANSTWTDAGVYQSVGLTDQNYKDIAESLKTKDDIIPNGDFASGQLAPFFANNYSTASIEARNNKNWVHIVGSDLTNLNKGVSAWVTKDTLMQSNIFTYPILLTFRFQTNYPGQFCYRGTAQDANGNYMGPIGPITFSIGDTEEHDVVLLIPAGSKQSINPSFTKIGFGIAAMGPTADFYVTDISTKSVRLESAILNKSNTVSVINSAPLSSSVLEDGHTWSEVSDSDTTHANKGYMLSLSKAKTDIINILKNEMDHEVLIYSDADIALLCRMDLFDSTGKYLGSTPSVTRFIAAGVINKIVVVYPSITDAGMQSLYANASTVNYIVINKNNEPTQFFFKDDSWNVHKQDSLSDSQLVSLDLKDNTQVKGWQIQGTGYSGIYILDGKPFVWSSKTDDGSAKYLYQTISKKLLDSYSMKWGKLEANFVFQSSNVGKSYTLKLIAFDANGTNLGESVKRDFFVGTNLEKSVHIEFGKLLNNLLPEAATSYAAIASIGIAIGSETGLDFVFKDFSFKRFTDKASNLAGNQNHLPIMSLYGTIPGDGNTTSPMAGYLDRDGHRTEIFSTIKWQGQTSQTFPKKNYKIKFYTDATLNTKLNFQPDPTFVPDNSFNLKASYSDFTFSLDLVLSQIWSEMTATRKNVPSQLLAGDNFGAIHGFPFILYVNDTYKGLYVFQTSKSNKVYGIDKNNASQFVVEGEDVSPAGMFAKDSDAIDGTNFELQLPDDVTPDILASWNALMTFVNSSSDADFAANVAKHIDVDAALDFAIFVNATNSTDNTGRNIEYATYDGQKFMPIAYDLNQGFGNTFNGDGLHPEDLNMLPLTDRLWTNTQNKFFSRTVLANKDAFKARYQQLRSGILSADHILNLFKANMQVIGQDNFTDEAAFVNSPSSKQATYQRLAAIVKTRLELVDQQIAAF